MDDKTFKAKLDELREIKKHLDRTGAGKSRHKDPDANPLNHFQANELLLEVSRRARLNTDTELVERPCDLLISLAGLSPMTTLTTLAVIRPKRLLLLYTDESERNVNFIHKYALQYNLLDSVSIHQEKCDPRDTLDIYKCIRRFLEGNTGKKIARNHILLDITGGKKSMSATGSLAAWQLDLGLVYLDGRFDTELGFSDPFSQKLFRLENPSTIFMDQQMAEADTMFEQGSYRSAAEAYAKIARFVPLPETARLREKVSRLYAAVCALQKKEILSACAELEQELPSNPSPLSRENRNLLRQQISFFREFASENDADKTPLLTYLLGRHYLEVRQPEFAVLFFYRSLEGCFTQRLRSVLALPSQPSFRLDYILPDRDLLGSPWGLEVCNDLGINPTEVGDVFMIGYTSAAFVLLLFNDEMMKISGFLENPEKRRELRRLGDLRNHSLLAHGETPVTDQEAYRFEKAACSVLNNYLRLMLSESKTVKYLQTQYSFLRKFD